MTLPRIAAELNDADADIFGTTEAPTSSTREFERMPNGPAASAPNRAGLERATRDARLALRAAAFAAAEAADRARSVAEVLDEALAILVATGSASSLPSPAAPSPTIDRLSSREREVLELVAEGHPNKAIAKALYVSPNTVKAHVASLLNKLDADNRAQLAAIATTHGVHPSRRDRRHAFAAPP